MSRVRHWIGEHLRYAADRIDREHAFVCTGLRLRYVTYKGAEVSFEGTGCRLWKRDNEQGEWLPAAHEHWFCQERGDRTRSWLQCACGERRYNAVRTNPYLRAGEQTT